MTQTTTNNSNIGSRKRRRRHENPNTEDRISQLPDTILSYILSLLPTNTAASTSVLSHRWHHQWTNVTNFQLDFDFSEHSSKTILSYTHSILSQLISPKLNIFYLVFPSESNIDELRLTEPCFRELNCRNIDQIIFNAGYRSFFRVPAACLFNSHSLVSLKLIGLLKIECDHDVLSAFRLPKLRNLSLCYLLDVPLCFGTLFKCCPELELLELSFDFVSLPQSQTLHPLIDVVSPNLKSLEISMTAWSQLERTVVSIDAPKLANLQIRDFNSVYSFVRSAASLGNACIDLRRGSSVEFIDDGEEDNDYAHKMFEFFRRMSSVVKLELMVDNLTNVFARLNCGITPVFDKLARIKTNCFKDLMLCLHHFPNLEHLEVSLWSEDYDFVMERRDWCAPDCVPDCLISKLKIVELGGIKGVDDDIDLIAYILSTALVLEKLCIAIRIEVNHEMGYAVGKACQYCNVLNLPRSSSACKVVVSRSITGPGGIAIIDSEASSCPEKGQH